MTAEKPENTGGFAILAAEKRACKAFVSGPGDSDEGLSFLRASLFVTSTTRLESCWDTCREENACSKATDPRPPVATGQIAEESFYLVVIGGLVQVTVEACFEAARPLLLEALGRDGDEQNPVL